MENVTFDCAFRSSDLRLRAIFTLLTFYFIIHYLEKMPSLNVCPVVYTQNKPQPKVISSRHLSLLLMSPDTGSIASCKTSFREVKVTPGMIPSNLEVFPFYRIREVRCEFTG